MRRLAAITLAAVLLPLSIVGAERAQAASGVQVSIFNFPGLTEGNGACMDEVDNLEEIITYLDYSVDKSIDSLVDANLNSGSLLTELNNSQFFFVPDMEGAFDPNSTSQFPTTAVTAFRTWLNGGGVLVMTGTANDKDTKFLNRITDYGLLEAGGSTQSRVDANAIGTPFDGFSGTRSGGVAYSYSSAEMDVSLAPHSATTSINGSNAPAGANFTPMWGSAASSVVATMSYGSGTIIYLGWDFYDSGDNGVADGSIDNPCSKFNDAWVQKITPAALNYASVLSGASALDNLSTTGGDLGYTFSQNGTAYYVVVDSDDTAPTGAQVKAAVDYAGGTVLASGNSSVTANIEQIFPISGLAEASDYVAYVVTEWNSPAEFSSLTTTSFSTKPGVPTVSSVSPGDGQVSVAISPSSNETNFRYSTDSWATSTTRSPAATSSPWVITGLTNGTEYSFQFRSIYSGQEGAATSTFTVTPRPPAVYLSDLTASTGTLSPSFDANTLSYSLSLSNATSALTLTPTSAGNTITVAGNATSSGQESASIPLSVGSNTVQVSVVSSATGAVPTVYTLTVTRAAAATTSSGNSGPTLTPEPTVTTPPVSPRVIPGLPETFPIQQGPVLRGNVPPAPPSAPVATLGGRSTPIQARVTSPTGFSLTAGVLNLGLEVQEDQGVVRQNNTGGTEIEVKKGSTAEVSGTGFLPRSTVQVFLPLQGTNAKEIARIPVDEAGSFSGDAVFATRVNERPLPIGKQVLQVVSLDEDGQQSVVEMTVNIAQSAPAPEPDRTVGATPTLRPGQFLATNAGEPEIVTVVPVPEDRQARVEGDGWQMSVYIPSANGSVARSDEGGAVLQLVRDETAVVSGTGFMPGTRADVWLFSEPTLLGTVDIDENGEFSGEVNIDSNVVVVGEHTLQLQGVGEDGYVRAANLGVVVNDTAAEATTEQAAGGFLWWLWLLVILVALVVWFAIWRYRRSREA